MMGTLKVMDGSGDSNLVWDSTRRDEVDAARELYNKLHAKGYNAYAVKKSGERAEQVTSFDPLMEKIIMAPAMRGG